MDDTAAARSKGEPPAEEITRRAYATRATKDELSLFNKVTQSERTEDSGWLSGLSQKLKNERDA